MSAKEMFEELGYERFEYSGGIRYTNPDLEQNIEFEYTEFINIYNTCPNIKQDIEVLDLDELQAINQQVKELGWYE